MPAEMNKLCWINKCTKNVYNDRLTVKRVIQLFRKDSCLVLVINTLYVKLTLGKWTTFCSYIIPQSKIPLLFVIYIHTKANDIIFLSIMTCSDPR